MLNPGILSLAKPFIRVRPSLVRRLPRTGGEDLDTEMHCSWSHALVPPRPPPYHCYFVIPNCHTLHCVTPTTHPGSQALCEEPGATTPACSAPFSLPPGTGPSALWSPTPGPGAVVGMEGQPLPRPSMGPSWPPGANRGFWPGSWTQIPSPVWSLCRRGMHHA